MPSFHWTGKSLAPPKPASLTRDSVLYPGGRGYPKSQEDGHVIVGESLSVMAALLPGYEGRINLIYADPPFFTNRKFAARIGKGEDSRTPSKWRLADGYHDAWPDLDSYLQFLYERLSMMYRLLAQWVFISSPRLACRRVCAFVIGRDLWR